MPRGKMIKENQAVENLRRRIDEMRAINDSSEEHIRKINILTVKLHNAKKRANPYFERAHSYTYELPIQIRDLND